jgi:hypothetical protein
MPVWHCSVSAWNARTERKVSAEKITEREAVRLLAGVGGEVEWWIYTPALIGHLRVAVTAGEYGRVPPGCVLADAGESGPQRDRTRL